MVTGLRLASGRQDIVLTPVFLLSVSAAQVWGWGWNPGRLAILQCFFVSPSPPAPALGWPVEDLGHHFDYAATSGLVASKSSFLLSLNSVLHVLGHHWDSTGRYTIQESYCE